MKRNVENEKRKCRYYSLLVILHKSKQLKKSTLPEENSYTAKWVSLLLRDEERESPLLDIHYSNIYSLPSCFYLAITKFTSPVKEFMIQGRKLHYFIKRMFNKEKKIFG